MPPHRLNVCPRDQAFLLYCDGLRSPAIAAELGVPERTVRAWIAAALDESAGDRRALRHEVLEGAIARLRATAQAAWDAVERVAEFDDGTLDRLALASPYDAKTPQLRLSPLGPRYLAEALSADRELARLLHLSDLTRDDETTLAIAAQTAVAAHTEAEDEADEADEDVEAVRAAFQAGAASARPMPAPTASTAKAAASAKSATPARSTATAHPMAPAPASVGASGGGPAPRDSAALPPTRSAAETATRFSSSPLSNTVQHRAHSVSSVLKPPSPDTLARMSATLERRPFLTAPTLGRSGG